MGNPANAPEVVSNPDWSRYPEVNEQESPPPAKHGYSDPPPSQPGYAAVPVPISNGDHAPNDASRQASWTPADAEKPTRNAPAAGQGKKEIFGIPRRNALLLAAGIVFVVVAIAVGVGVGVGVTTHKNSTPSTSQPTSSTSTGLPTYGSGLASATSSALGSAQTVAAVNCATIPNNTFTSATPSPSSSQTNSSTSTPIYRILCAVHWLTNQPALNGDGVVLEVGADNLVASTFEQCLGFCDEYNRSLNTTVDPQVPGSGCLAVTFNGQTQQALDQYGRNCFLKDRQGVYSSAMQTTESAVLIST